MKLVKQIQNHWHYQLNSREAESLRALVGGFPMTALSSVPISRTDTDPKAVEREKLLNESLAEHRKELERKAKSLVGVDRFKVHKAHQIFQIDSGDREMLLQILNDIRIESWRILGEPEELEIDPHTLEIQKLRHYHLMHLAGYFEHHLLENAG